MSRLPDLACVKHRQVGILFDSNAADNRDVKRARAAFDSTLRELGASAVIKLSLPKGDWNGPDDYIAAAGDDAMVKVLERKPWTERVAAAEQAIAALESDKKADPMSAIEAVGAVSDAARRELLIGRLAALRISA